MVWCIHPMNPERNPIPEWAQAEREQDMSWIRRNLDVFWYSATIAVRQLGRGAIFVDALARPLGQQNLFTFFTLEEVVAYENEDINRMIEDYNPEQEFVIVLLKQEGRMSSYRVQPQPSSQGGSFSEV